MYKIVIGDEIVGIVSDGGKVTINSSPGRHIMYLKIDYARSAKIAFEITDDEEVKFVCSPSARGYKFILLPIYLTLLKNQYINLYRA